MNSLEALQTAVAALITVRNISPDSPEFSEVRQGMCEHLNSNPKTREQWQAEGVQTWNTEQFTNEFEVHSFYAPFVFVTRKSDKVGGTMMFQHHPRLYFNFEPCG